MLKNIFIHIGSYSSVACIKQFCVRHADYLEQEGFWLPDYEELFKLFPPEMSGLKYYQTLCLRPVWQDLLGIPSSEDILIITKNKLLNKPHIHTLIYFFPYVSSQSSNNSRIISSIKQIFPSTTLNICWIKAPFSSEVESIHCRLTTCHASHFSLSTFTNEYLTSPLLWANPKAHLPKDTKLSIDTIQCEEKDLLFQWQKYMGLPLSFPQMKPISSIVSPKALAFIMGIQPIFAPKKVEGKYILMKNSIFYNWLEQEKMLEFENDKQTKNQYLREYWKNQLNLAYSQNTASSLPDKNNYEIISEVPITISVEDAKILTSLLTPDFRKLVAQNIDQANLKYKTQDARTAQGALLLAEKVIDEDEFKKLTEYPRGLCLPVSQKSTIEVCNSPPTVAVLTLCYNQKDYIEENILSVMAQETKFPVVHIIADDASTDGTQEILKKYAEQYPHIHLILNGHNRASQNIINLFSQAKTPYVALCDGDDYFTDPLKLQSQVDLLEENPSYGLCFHLVKILYEDYPNEMHIYPNERVLHRGVQPHYYLADLMRRNLIQTNSVMYRWRFRDGLPAWFNPKLCPGDWYWHLLHAECGKIGFINKVMSVYRRHKRGLFYKTITDVAEHRKTYGIKEIAFYEHLNLHFEGRYKKIMDNQILRVFTCMLVESEKTGDDTAFQALLETYPHHIDKLRLHIAKAKEANTSV